VRVLKKVGHALKRAAKAVGRAAVAVAKAAYKYSGAQDVVSCVTHPSLAGCAKAALTVALTVGTAGEGEAVEVGLNVAEHAGEDVAENAGEHVAEEGVGDSLKDAVENCAGGESFSAGTKVLLANGTAVAISQLKPGEKVLATNPKTGVTKAETISIVWVRHDTDLYRLKVQSGADSAVIQTTSNHLFWDVTTRAWVNAARLHRGDHLRTPSGGYATVVAGWAPRDHTGWMWDLTIPADHDFYLVTGTAAVLVHNQSCPTSRAARRQAMRDQGIPTSQQPDSQLSTVAGYQYTYTVPAEGGGERLMTVTDQTTDDVADHGPHWEAGPAKDAAAYGRDPLGRLRVFNSKSKVPYGG
jgi:hypothetical protein